MIGLLNGWEPAAPAKVPALEVGSVRKYNSRWMATEEHVKSQKNDRTKEVAEGVDLLAIRVVDLPVGKLITHQLGSRSKD